jgi:hypothetical protein
MDNTTMKPGTITTTEMGTIFQGESATRLFQLRVIIKALEMELKYPDGPKMTRHGALPIAKKLTGLTTNRRQLHIDKLTHMHDELAQNVQVVRGQ